MPANSPISRNFTVWLHTACEWFWSMYDVSTILIPKRAAFSRTNPYNHHKSSGLFRHPLNRWPSCTVSSIKQSNYQTTWNCTVLGKHGSQWPLWWDLLVATLKQGHPWSLLSSQHFFHFSIVDMRFCLAVSKHPWNMRKANSVIGPDVLDCDNVLLKNLED